MAKRPYSELDCLRELVDGFKDANPTNISILKNDNDEVETIVYYRNNVPYQIYTFFYDAVGNLINIDITYNEEV